MGVRCISLWLTIVVLTVVLCAVLGGSWGCGGGGRYSSRIWRTQPVGRESPAFTSRGYGQNSQGYGQDSPWQFASLGNEFETAGPLRPKLDFDRLMQARLSLGQYRVVVGDVLEFSMPAILRVLVADLTDSLGQVEAYRCRVNKQGKVTLPIVGDMVAGGRTLAEIEAAVVEAYYPRYVLNPPSVVARVFEHRMARVAMLGAVNKPGVYECPSHEMSLVSLIMKAEGIVEGGATTIRIRRVGESASRNPISLPVKGLNIPFSDVPLQDGDTVEVERLPEQRFMVIGLVNKAGDFPYSAGVRYNLLQALAFAGGVNEYADPRYARIYRQTANGRIIDRTCKLRGLGIGDACNIIIKPGDVVAVEHTTRTRLRLLISSILRIDTRASVIFQP